MGGSTVDAVRSDGRRTSVRPVPPQRNRRGPLRDALLLLAALAVAAGGVWGLLAPRDSHEHVAAQGQLVEVGDGVLRVDGLADKTVAHAMPGMGMPDEVAPGMRRFAVNVTLAATGDEPLRYGERDFLVSGPGIKPVVPVRGDFDGGSVAAGSALSGSLTFDVPEDATVVRMSFQGGEPVALPTLPEVATGGHAGPSAEGDGHPHGDDGHAHGDAQGAGEHPHGDAQGAGENPHGDHAH